MSDATQAGEVPEAPELAPDESPDEPTCSCGHTDQSGWVTRRSIYAWWAWVFVAVIGISATPVRIDLRCRRCREVLYSLTDPADLVKDV